MKLIGLERLGDNEYKASVTCDLGEAIALLGGNTGATAEPAKRASKKTTETPAATATPATETKPATAAAQTNGAPAKAAVEPEPFGGLDDLDEAVDIPKELATATVLRGVVEYVMAAGAKSKDQVLGALLDWKKKGGDKIPVLHKIEEQKLRERIDQWATARGIA